MLDVILKSFDNPDDVQLFAKGKFEVVNIGGLTIGRATYQPGWKWSVDVGPQIGEDLCSVEHVGMVISGTATAAFEDGRVIELKPGKLFYIPRILTTAGSLAMNRTSRCTFSALTSTRNPINNLNPAIQSTKANSGF